MLKSKPPIYIGNLRQCFNPCLCVTCPQTIAFDLLFTPPGHRARVLRAGRLGRPQRRAGLVKTIEKVEFPILVFVELALGEHLAVPPRFGFVGFQSLFSWNLPSKLLEGYCRLSRLRVSILVFVELALEGLGYLLR